GGGAETQWKRPGCRLGSETQVLRTPRMVRLDWKRTVKDPRVLPCLRHGVVKHLVPGEKLVSIHGITVPQLATFTAEYRVVLSVPTQSGRTQVFVQALAFGAGRDENSLIVSGLRSDLASLQKTQLQVARHLAKRLP